jgi:hypothetical protein
MRRFTVMGFTEAELGFVLAGVFAALAASTTSDRQSAVTAHARSDSLTRRLDSVTAELTAFRDSVAKKSNKTPRCSEKGESAAPIARLRVLGRDRYDFDGAVLSFRDVEARLAPEIARARALGCRYLVETVATPGVDGPEHSAAVSRLWSQFDVHERQR